MDLLNYSIQSKSRNYLKIILLVFLCIITLYLTFKYKIYVILILSSFLLIRILFETLFYAKKTLNIADNILILSKSTPITAERIIREIPLVDIMFAAYNHKIYDTNEFFMPWNWEILFPSGQSTVIIHLKSKKKIEINFNCDNVVEMNKFIAKLPHTIPNQNV